MAPSAGSPFDGAEIISSYSRAQAIEDGVLVDVSETAREVGIRFPVAMTRTAWTAYVEVPAGVSCQDEAGRLWDVVSMLRFAIARSRGGPEIRYQLRVRNDNRRPRLVTLKSICGPGDEAEPVITIMLPEED
jgi:hypothetical protein